MNVTGLNWWSVNIAITWTNFDPDLCRHKASLGHNELNEGYLMMGKIDDLLNSAP